MSEIRYARGRLSYRRKSTGVERGREDWNLTRNRDGTRTMRCLAMTDDSRVVRDVTYTLDANANPVEAFIRLQVGDRWIGSGYFRIDANRLRVVCDGATTGRALQTIKTPPRFHIITHAVMLDGWAFWHYDLEKGGALAETVCNTSPMWNGVTGPLGGLETALVNYVGVETITVPAGTFSARHFRLDSDKTISPDGSKTPTSDLWVTGEDNLLVRYDWDGLDLEYLLTSLVVE